MAGERAVTGGFTSPVQPGFVPSQGSEGTEGSVFSVNTTNCPILKTVKGERENALLN